jgi:diguanylate cyclase (GGDEF)-like protein
VVVVDDSRFQREAARDALEATAAVELCSSGESALAALAREPADLVITDLTMPGMSGLELLERVQRVHPGTDVVLVTGNASIDSAVQALRTGATDYLQKPVGPDDLVLVVERTMARRRLVEENLRLRDERAILEACKALTPCLEPEDVYGVGLDLTLRALARSQGFALYHRTSIPASDGLQCRGLEEPVEAALRAGFSKDKPIDFSGFTATMVLDRGPILEACRSGGVDVARLLAVPARGEEGEEGLFVVLDEGREFDGMSLDRVELVRGHACVSLRNAERYRSARERAFLDDVTGIYNARYLLEAVDREARRAERYGNDLSVLFLDLDRFKLVNDRHGHLVGSQALRQLSRLLGSCVRQVDTLARYGGDEFTIILLDTGEQAALEVAERIRRTVEAHAFEAGPGQVMHLTCSIGVSSYPTHGRDREPLLDASDKAMYRAKSEGRNRVCSASELGSHTAR